MLHWTLTRHRSCWPAAPPSGFIAYRGCQFKYGATLFGSRRTHRRWSIANHFGELLDEHSYVIVPAFISDLVGLIVDQGFEIVR